MRPEKLPGLEEGLAQSRKLPFFQTGIAGGHGGVPTSQTRCCRGNSVTKFLIYSIAC